MFKKQDTNFRANSKTKSANKKVLDVYDIILTDEYSDTDFWYLCGKDYFFNPLSKFNREDWNDLINDITNWTKTQLEILAIVLVEGDFDDSTNPELISRVSEVYSAILANCDDDTFVHFIDELEFIQFNSNKDINALVSIKNRLIRLKGVYFSSNKNYTNYCNLIQEEIEKMNISNN